MREKVLFADEDEMEEDIHEKRRVSRKRKREHKKLILSRSATNRRKACM